MKIGDTVKFRYYGGSNYGGIREVKINKETAKTWGGIDLRENVYKNYMKDKMRDISIVSSGTFEDAKQELEVFLKGKNFSLSLIRNLVSEFNKAWNVNYDYNITTKKLALVPKEKAGVLAFDAVKNLENGDITLDIGGLKLKLSKDGSIFINNAYKTVSWTAYNKINNF